MLIRSRLHYGAIVYNSASQTIFCKLNPIESKALRIVTGTFKSLPTDSLAVLTNEMPRSLRREEQPVR